MKRIGLALGACSVIALGGAGMAGAAGGGSGDSVTGALKRGALDSSQEQHHIVSAHDGPNGATGTYRATYGKGKSRIEYAGRVTCVNVVGNKAKVGIVITESNDNEARVGRYELIRFADYGTPNDGGAADAVSPAPPVDAPVSCDGPVDEFSPTFSGNLTVKDGS
jgi:hypothetical protein